MQPIRRVLLLLVMTLAFAVPEDAHARFGKRSSDSSGSSSRSSGSSSRSSGSRPTSTPSGSAHGSAPVNTPVAPARNPTSRDQDTVYVVHP
ncbi:MAG: hypothetical protein ACK4N5_24925, partial [Myxococcales bacterium]